MMNNLLRNLTAGTVMRNLAILVSGTVLAQLVVVGFQIVLRRIFTPADFGAFAVYMSLIGILATISSLRYEQAIVLPANDSRAYHLLWLSVWLAAITSGLIALFIVFFNHQALTLSGIPLQYKSWLQYVPLSVFLFSVYQALNYYLIRLKMYKQSASNKVERRLFEGVTQTVLGKFGVHSALVMGDLVGQAANVLFAGIKLRPQFKGLFVKWKLLKETTFEYRHFPLQNGIPSLLNTFSLLLPVIFINKFFDAQTTGFFDLARLILIIPLSLITASLSQVMLQQFTEYRNQNKSIRMPLLKIAGSLSLISVLFLMVILAFAPLLLRMVFGSGWEPSGYFARILVWAFALKFIISPFNILFTVFEKLKWLAWWQFFYFAGILSLMVIPHHNIEWFLYFYTFIEIVSSLLAAILCYKLISHYELNRPEQV